MVRHAVPSHRPTANQRLQNNWQSIFWFSMIASIALHWGAFEYWPNMQAADISYVAHELEAIEIPDKVEIPPPPEAVARPARPVIGDATIDPDITIHQTTLAANPIQEFLPPPEPARRDAQSITPESFTPFEVPPRIMNAEEVQQALADNYPDLLKQAGIGGEVRVWFWIDETGLVRDRQVLVTSGQRLLDDAALDVADIMRFSPAQNRDQCVPVGVTFPIRFVVR